MSEKRVFLITGNADFREVVAEQIGADMATAEKDATLVVTTEPYQGPLPAIKVELPVKLWDLLNKIESFGQETWKLGKAEFSPQQKTLALGKQVIDLTDKESQLLQLLLKQSFVAKDDLLKTVWGMEKDLETHTLETHIYRLRAKLRDLGVKAAITAVPGGYMLAIE